MNTDTSNTLAAYSCLQFRREKLADPKRISAAAHAHLHGCQLCQAFARRLDAMENEIAQTLAVPVPEGLSDRILLHTLPSPPRIAWRAWAMAATVLITIGIGLGSGLFLAKPNMNLAQEGIAHVMHEPESYTEHRLADPKRFDTVLASFGGTVEEPIGTVRYMKLCPVPGGTGWHIVLDTEYGMVTLILMPGQSNQGLEHARERGMQALARPRGQGYYVIVADNDKAMQYVSDALEHKVRWNI